MNSLHLLAYHHGFGGGMADWIAHVAISSLIHSLIYSVAFRLIYHLTMTQAVVLAVLVLGAVRMWARLRDRRGW